MELSNHGLLEIAEHEGIVPAPYLDSNGNWTFGIGHTAAAGDPDPAKMSRGMPLPNEENQVLDLALNIFRDDLQSVVKRVNQALKVPVSQAQFDALVSFDFNTGGIFVAKLTEAINAGDPKASRHFMGWLKPPEVRQRREAEQALFETGDYNLNGDRIAIWRADSMGRLVGRIGSVTGAELLARMDKAPDPDPNTAEDVLVKIRSLVNGYYGAT